MRMMNENEGRLFVICAMPFRSGAGEGIRHCIMSALDGVAFLSPLLDDYTIS